MHLNIGQMLDHMSVVIILDTTKVPKNAFRFEAPATKPNNREASLSDPDIMSRRTALGSGSGDPYNWFHATIMGTTRGHASVETWERQVAIVVA